MKVWVLFKVIDMSDYHDNEYNLADDHKELRGIYATKDAAERNKKILEDILDRHRVLGCDESYVVIEEHNVSE